MSNRLDLRPHIGERESVPFRVRTADGDSVELTYSSPRPAASHDELSVLETLLPGCMIADGVAVIGSLDIVLGEVDR